MAIYLKAANHAALLLPERTKSLGQATIGRDIFEAAFKEQPDLLQGITLFLKFIFVKLSLVPSKLIQKSETIFQLPGIPVP
jgi:hypothetical protein